MHLAGRPRFLRQIFHPEPSLAFHAGFSSASPAPSAGARRRIEAFAVSARHRIVCVNREGHQDRRDPFRSIRRSSRNRTPFLAALPTKSRNENSCRLRKTSREEKAFISCNSFWDIDSLRRPLRPKRATGRCKMRETGIEWDMALPDFQRESYDAVVVGTGFASSFFLHGYLEKAPPSARILVLERGPRQEHSESVEDQQNPSSFVPREADKRFKQTGDPQKAWRFTIAFGGGSNCWWGNTPRFLPADFEMASRFGVGRDWPVGYDDLAPYYEVAETLMSVSGPSGPWPYPRTGGYPQPPHGMNNPERLLKAAYPNSFFSMPSARARVATKGRSVCCANGVCHLCPVDAKFRIQNGLMSVYEDPRVTVVVDAEVLAVDVRRDTAEAVLVWHESSEKSVSSDLVVLGANAIFNPAILQRSSLTHPVLGRRLHEQVGLVAEVHLDGLDSFQGSTSVTGQSYMLYDDEDRRREMAACLIETWNVGRLRNEFGRWKQVLPVRMVFDNLPDEQNYVQYDPAEPDRPLVHYAGHGQYAARAIANAQRDLERVMAPLPVERIVLRDRLEHTEAHILGTTPMGNDPATSIVDRNSVHHKVRNLLVLGSGTFPVGGPANPTLTITALSLRSAHELMA